MSEKQLEPRQQEGGGGEARGRGVGALAHGGSSEEDPAHERRGRLGQDGGSGKGGKQIDLRLMWEEKPPRATGWVRTQGKERAPCLSDPFTDTENQECTPRCGI